MTNKRISQLIPFKQRLFHAQDLGVIWNIRNPNTLHTTLKRLHQNQILFPIYKGLFSIIPPNQIDPWELGIKSLNRYAYISGETILAKSGIISQNPNAITIISDISRKFKIFNINFSVRKMKTKFLYSTSGIYNTGSGVLVATLERAVADMHYYAPNYHFDQPHLFDIKKVKIIQKEVGYDHC